MARATMNFKKGDSITHYFRLPTASWSAGGALFFAAKSAPDDDATDGAAVIDKEFSDSDIVTIGHDEYLVGFVTYALNFLAADTSAVSFADGSKKKKYLGEFQFVPTDNQPQSFPGDDDFIEVIVYADIKRAIT